MLKPTNAIAETVDDLKKQNENIQFQINYYKDLFNKNAAAIESLTPLGTWEEVPDEIVS